MKRLVVVCLLAVVTVFAWRIADRLSADALGMAIGVAFGVIAGIPAALLVMASSRRRDGRDDEQPGPRVPRGQLGGHPAAPYGYLPQPPVIILAGNGMHPQATGAYQNMAQPRQADYALPAPPQNVVDTREFRVIGETDESLDEW